MKLRILSSIVMLLALIPILLIGGIPFKILVMLIAIIGINEFLNARKSIPKLIKALATLTILLCINASYLKVFPFILTVFLILTVFHNKYSANDAVYTILGILMMYLSSNFTIVLRNTNYKILIYLLIITTMTDTCAYIVGSLIGKHKLIPQISPKKTVEGLLGGLLGGTIIPIIYYLCNFNVNNLLLLLIKTIILSLLCQFGDLFFSSIKRENKIKDFSNLIPGHGGVLDRIDGLLFVILGYFILV